MQYGFVIDNRKCIGCHACTVACKSEHDVAIGVNRTWVKQTEKGEFPNTRRVFSVLRCNHCTDAPCVEICPVQALFVREDGIVDFNNDRCIGCKSCMQACPYDALYIDPDTHTAAKCNYCSHRVDIGLEPACVNVCPEHAIISGDIENPSTEISQLLAREQVTVRKPEKGTKPNVYYINGDEASLTPSETTRTDQYIWNSQEAGVGHYSKFVDQLMARKQSSSEGSADLSKELTYGGNSPKKSVEVLMQQGGKARRVYDTPDKGLLWGWEVSAYVLTKAIASGVVILSFFISLLNPNWLTPEIKFSVGGIALIFLALTGALLVMDLDQPKRFLYVLLRPQWKSWLTRGGYAITIFGGAVTVWIVAAYFKMNLIETIAFWLSTASAFVVAVYTAFLFAQAKGRDFWQSPSLILHMLAHSAMAGAGSLLLVNEVYLHSSILGEFSLFTLGISLLANMAFMLFELMITHPTQDAKRVVGMIVSGRYKTLFWIGVVVLGNVVPFLVVTTISEAVVPAAILSILGIFITEKIWIEAPQRIQLT